MKLSDKREYRGQILGTDSKTDLAVIRFQSDHELTVATLGNSEALRLGEWAIAIDRRVNPPKRAIRGAPVT